MAKRKKSKSPKPRPKSKKPSSTKKAKPKPPAAPPPGAPPATRQAGSWRPLNQGRFPVNRDGENDRWLVHIPGGQVEVTTQEDADTLAGYPLAEDEATLRRIVKILTIHGQKNAAADALLAEAANRAGEA
jgi:hypothetical protein